MYPRIQTHLKNEGSSLIQTNRVVPLTILTQSTGNIMGITKTVQEMSQKDVFHQREIQFFLADIAICHKWWLHFFSENNLQQDQHLRQVIFFGSWHPFKQALKIL